MSLLSLLLSGALALIVLAGQAGAQVALAVSPTKKSYREGEPIFLDCTFRNSTDEEKTVSFGDFGTELVKFKSAQAHENIYYRFAVDGFSCRDPITIPPRETAHQILPLNQWCFFKTGKHMIESSFVLEGKTLKKEFTIVVLPPNSKALAASVQELFRWYGSLDALDSSTRSEISLGMSLAATQFPNFAEEVRMAPFETLKKTGKSHLVGSILGNVKQWKSVERTSPLGER